MGHRSPAWWHCDQPCHNSWNLNWQSTLNLARGNQNLTASYSSVLGLMTIDIGVDILILLVRFLCIPADSDNIHWTGWKPVLLMKGSNIYLLLWYGGECITGLKIRQYSHPLLLWGRDARTVRPKSPLLHPSIAILPLGWVKAPTGPSSPIRKLPFHWNKRCDGHELTLREEGGFLRTPQKPVRLSDSPLPRYGRFMSMCAHFLSLSSMPVNADGIFDFYKLLEPLDAVHFNWRYTVGTFIAENVHNFRTSWFNALQLI